MDNNEMMKELKKQTLYQKITCFSVVGVLVALVITCLVVVPKVTGALDSATAVLNQVENMHLDELPINELVETVDNFGEKVDDLDFNSLNNTIEQLGDAIESMNAVFSVFRR